MNAAHDVAECSRLEHWVTAYVDDELDAIHALEVETHIAECEPCDERITLLRATRCSLKRALSAKCPGALRARICRVLVDARREDEDGLDADAATAALDAAALNDGDGDAPASLGPLSRGPSSMADLHGSVAPPRMGPVAKTRGPLVKLHYMVPLAAAATVLLVFGVMRLESAEPAVAERPSPSSTAAVASLDYLLEEMVAQHAHPPPPETTDPNDLSKWDRYLGLRVPRPKFEHRRVRYIGARMMPRQTAMLQYMLRDKRRMTLYVFDSKRIPLRAQRLKHRHIGARNVYVGKLRGYSVAASERDGIGYALASDLSDEESAELLVAAAP